MDRRMTMRAVAEEVLQGAQKAGGEQAGQPGDAGKGPKPGDAKPQGATGSAARDTAGGPEAGKAGQ
jgi:hypothetical protein